MNDGSGQSLPVLLAAMEFAVSDLKAVGDILQDAIDVATGDVPWDRDISASLATNPNSPGLLQNGWWMRKVEQIATLCFHHTNGWTSPELFAGWYVGKDGGRPRTCYSIWITDTGEVLLCNQLEVGCWHNHTTHKNVDLSVTLAGRRHIYAPSPAQMAAAARVAAWAIKSPLFPLITSTDQIKGHMDYKRPGFTECPGWSGEKGAGHWRPVFYSEIEARLS